MELIVKKLSAMAWAVDRGDVDFQIQLVDGAYAVDVFDRTVHDPASACLASYSGHTWNCVEAYVLNFNPESGFPEPGYGETKGYVLVN